MATQAGGTLAILFGAIAGMVTLDPWWTLGIAGLAGLLGAVAFGLAARHRG